MADEGDLRARLLLGAQEAEGDIVRLYRPRLLRSSKVFLGDLDAEAEDMVQDTFLVVLPRLDHRDLSASVYPRLRQVCIRLCSARRHSRDGVLACLEDELRAYMLRKNVEPVRSLNPEVVFQQKMSLLRDMVKPLTPARRQLIQLRNVHGMNYAQIGLVLAIPVAVVSERLAESREQLRLIAAGPIGQDPGGATTMRLHTSNDWRR
jgi:RNA polymerase sigma factor (sigma-70 family)